MDFAMGVVADLLGTFKEETKEFQRAATYDAKFVGAVTLARMHKDSRPFRDKPVSVRPIQKNAYHRGA
jgi:hypothetical protein